jgi:NitT/TauT family transport system permease protein
MLNAIMAFSSLSLELTRFCRLTSASAWRAFTTTRLPSVMPQSFLGFKCAAINAATGTAIAAFICFCRELGFYNQIVACNMRPHIVFAGVILLAQLGQALFGAVTLAEWQIIPWHIPEWHTGGS